MKEEMNNNVKSVPIKEDQAPPPQMSGKYFSNQNEKSLINFFMVLFNFPKYYNGITFVYIFKDHHSQSVLLTLIIFIIMCRRGRR